MSYMTMGDEIHALRTTLARVEAERNEYRDLADKWRDDWTAAMDSRDALAAHVETAKGVMHRLIETERYMRGPRPPAVQEYLDWMDATPTTSLARLKAEWQAEALKSFANWLPSDYEGSEFQAGIDQARQHAKDCAARNRRQAEGGIMSIIEYTGPSNPQEIRKYLMRRTKDEIVWEYLRQWREYGDLEAERDGWEESARHFANGQEFYQGIVRQVGDLFGEAARISDDGSVQEDVLALKVPELVEALAAHVEALRSFLRSAPLESGVCCCGDNIDNHPDPMSCGHSPVDSGEYAISQILDETPAASRARLKAEWQAAVLHKACNDGLWGSDLRNLAFELEEAAGVSRMSTEAHQLELHRQAEGGPDDTPQESG